MGTLGQKLDYLTDTKSILKQKINNLGGSLTDESTFRSYGNYLDELYNEMPKVTGEGTEITLTPTRKGRMQLDLKGNTSQATRILPEGYTQLDYIESTGTQYIDTGIKPYRTTTEHTFAFTDITQPTNCRSYGAYDNTTSPTKRYYGCIVGLSDSNFKYANRDAIQVTIAPADTNKHTMIINDSNNSIYFDGNLVGTSNLLNLSAPAANNIYIFSTSTPTGVSANASVFMKLYNFKIYDKNDDNKLLRDYIPCKDSNNVVGLYDLVSQTFFGNAGTGDFVAGNEVSIPNPDYPQPIHVVTGNNTIGVTGKNIFSGDTLIQVGGTGTKRNGFYVTTPGTYTVSYSNNNSSRYFSFRVIDNGVYGTYSSINSPYTFTISQNQTAIVYIGDENKTFSQQGFYNVQIELGSTATSYVPYYHADYPINLGSIELCEIGDYSDEIFKNEPNNPHYDSSLVDGGWYKYGAISKTTLNGSETYTSANTGANVNTTRYYARTSINRVASVGLFNKFINRDASMSHGDYEYNWFNDTDFYINILKSRLSEVSIDGIKQYVTSNNLTGYGALNTPTSTQITDETLISQLDAIENAMSTTDTTTISQTNSDLPFIITASALKPFTTETLLTSLTDGE